MSRSFDRKQHRREHPDIFEEKVQSSREKNKARALRNSAWWRKKISTGICYYCGEKFPPSELTMDHRVPISRGGKSEKSNCVPACKECNNKKMYLLPMEWEEYLNKIGGSGHDI